MERLKASNPRFKAIDSVQRDLHLQINKHCHFDLRNIVVPEADRQADIKDLKEVLTELQEPIRAYNIQDVLDDDLLR